MAGSDHGLLTKLSERLGQGGLVWVLVAVGLEWVSKWLSSFRMVLKEEQKGQHWPGKVLNLEKAWFEDARDGFVVIWWQARKDGNTRNPAMHETI